MSWLWWLILGLLVGWIVEWVIDWLFWRRGNDEANSPLQGRIQQLEAEFNRARADNQKLQSDLSAARAEAQQHQAALVPLETSLADCRQRYAHVERELTTIKAQPGANSMILPIETPEQQPAEQHNKTMILTPEALAEARQNEAGDKTLLAAPEALAATPSESDAVVEQARAADRPDNKTIFLTAEALADELKADRSETPVADAKATVLLSSEELAQATAALDEQEVGEPSASGRRDPLVDIDGIGPVYERKLFAAGILTFAQLAALTPERLREIINPERWQSIDAESWIAEAQQFAERTEGSHGL